MNFIYLKYNISNLFNRNTITMNIIKFISLVILVFSVVVLNGQSFKYPVNEKGVKVACEKFEQLEHYINRTNLELNPNSGNKKQKSDKRSAGEVQVNSNTNEFELHAAVNPIDQDNIIVGCIKLDPSNQEESISIGIYTTNDGADSWTRSSFNGVLVPGSTPIGGGDPVVVFDNDGVAHLTWLVITLQDFVAYWGIYYATSNDGGLTWLGRNPVIETSFNDLFGLSDLAFAADKQWMVSDNSLTSPNQGNIYVAFVNIKDITLPTPAYEITFQRKVAGQESFDFDNAIVLNTNGYNIAQFTSIDTDREGNIYVTFLADDNEDPNQYAIYMAKSTDGGQTFSPEQKVKDFNFAELGNSQGEVIGIGDTRLYPCPHIGIDKSGGEFDGRLYVAYTATIAPGSNIDGYDIYLTTSDDEGETWASARVVNDDSDPITEQFYSAINISSGGDVSLSWYDGRDANETISDMNYYLGVSKDGGETFEQFSVSSEASDFSSIGNLNQGFGIGEYNQVVSTDKYIIPFWADGRSNSGEISIYGFKQDISTISSTEDGLVKLNSDIFITSVSPNPASENITVEFSLTKSQLVLFEIVDMFGKIVINSNSRTFQTGKSTLDINVNQLSSGQYILVLATDKDRISRKVSVLRD